MSTRFRDGNLRRCLCTFVFIIIFGAVPIENLFAQNGPAPAPVQAPAPTPRPAPARGAASTSVQAPAAALTTPSQCYVEAAITGVIGPATLDFFARAQQRVQSFNCGALLLLVNTPGGNLQTTRMIVEKILNSATPVLCLVYPSGAHAGSAGAIILQACHIAGAMEATNIGAATPVSGSGEQIPDDLRRKLINDTKSWVEGLAELRKRSTQFAVDIVEEAKSVSADEALKIRAIDYVAKSKKDFVNFAQNKTVQINPMTSTTLSLGEPRLFEQDLRFRVMDLLMSPQVSYLMFMGSIGLLYFELTHPGMIAPGVIGGVGLLISLISMHMLDVTWGAVLLIFAGIALMIAEAFVAGFGILGVGGTISFFIGSLFLFDFEQSGYMLPLKTILPTTILIGLIMIGIAYLAFSARKRRTHAGTDDLVGRVGIVTEVQEGEPTFGYIEIQGEIWKVCGHEPLQVGEKVRVITSQGLTLTVSKVNEK